MVQEVADYILCFCLFPSLSPVIRSLKSKKKPPALPSMLRVVCQVAYFEHVPKILHSLCENTAACHFLP